MGIKPTDTHARYLKEALLGLSLNLSLTFSLFLPLATKRFPNSSDGFLRYMMMAAMIFVAMGISHWVIRGLSALFIEERD
jgi:hypothetical protein